MRDKLKVKGLVTVRVFYRDVKPKLRPMNWFMRVLGLQGRVMVSRHHNIVTRQGDALIADALLAAPNRNKVTNANGYIQVGTGWTGNSTKTNTGCNTASGGAKELDAGYPCLKAAWGGTGDTTVVYRATFEAGKLDANGINEACLLNGNLSGADCLAYAQITPAANVTPSDTLQIVWEITILGQ
jgi:hypothetical protein